MIGSWRPFIAYTSSVFLAGVIRTRPSVPLGICVGHATSVNSRWRRPATAIIRIEHGGAIANAGLRQRQLDAFRGLAVTGDIGGNRAHLSAQRWPQLAGPSAIIKSADGIEARSGAASSDWNVGQHATTHASLFRG
jgi:hypothetical protein